MLLSSSWGRRSNVLTSWFARMKHRAKYRARLSRQATHPVSAGIRSSQILEKRTLLAADLTLLEQGLNDAFGGFQDALNAQVFQTDLPLVGDGLKDEGTSGQVFTELANGIGNNFQNVETVDQAKAAITTAFGADLNAAISTTGNDGDDVITFGVSLTPSLTKTVPFDLGLDSVGLSLTGDVSVTLAATLNLEFGVDNNSFFVSTGGANPEFELSLIVGIPNFDATGTFGDFLEVSAKDSSETPSSFTATFGVDVLTSNGRLENFSNVDFVTSLTGTADLNLDLEAAIPGNEIAPKLLAEFNVDWQFDAANPEGDAAVFGNRPSIAFNEIRLDMNSFFQKFAAPVVTRVQSVLQPIQPLVNVLTEPIPLLEEINKVAPQPIGPRLVDLIGNQSITNFSTAVRNVLEISVPDVDFALPLGSFTLVDPRGGTARAIDQQMMEPDPLATARTMGGSAVGNFFDKLQNEISGKGLEFPILQDPSEVFQLLIGQDATLFTWDMPAIGGEWELNRFVPVFGPLGVEFGGSIGFNTDFAFGYDTVGIREFRAGGNEDISKILNGFFVSDRAMADGTGNDVDEVNITGRIEASAKLETGFLSAQAGGGFTADIALNLNDPDGDGRVRANELTQNASQNPLNVFDVSGALTADLFLRGELSIKVGRFSIGESFEYPHKFEPLIFYERIGGPQAEPGTPILASQSGGTLTLHTGPQASQREKHNITDGDETFLVRQALDAAGAAIPGTVVVAAFGFEQQFDGVTHITGNGGSGNDRIVVEAGITATAELLGGNGNDTLQFSGSGNATLRGGTGNDRLVGGTGQNILFGDENNDSLTGGDMLDTLEGGTGNDQLFGLGENDQITGGDGDDFADGGEGADTIVGGIGNDELKGGAGNDSLSGEAGDDRLLGGEDADVITGSDGNDTLFGDAGTDSLSGGANDDFIAGGADNDTLTGEAGNDTLDGQAGNDSVDGGADDDFLNASTMTAFFTRVVTPNGQDTLIGGDGNDRLFARDATESVTLMAGMGDDTIHGTSASEMIDAGPGNDVVYAGDGDDTVLGGVGNDRIDGGAGDDSLDGQDGRATLIGGEGDDVLIAGDLRSVLEGGDGNDSLTGTPQNDELNGGDGNDTLVALAGDDTIATGRGDDSVLAGDGNDNVTTGLNFGGRNTIDGGAGDDTIDALGTDTVNAGAGNDSVKAGGFTEPSMVDLGDGNDQFVPHFTRVSVLGGLGDDTLTGGGSESTLRGGAGSDVFLGFGEAFGEAGPDLFLSTNFTATDADVDLSTTVENLDALHPVGRPLRYTVQVTNHGSDFAGNVNVSTAVVSGPAGGGTIVVPVNTDGLLAETLVPVIAPGGTSGFVQTRNTFFGQTGIVTYSATASTSGPDTDDTNDSTSETTELVQFSGDTAVSLDGGTLRLTATDGGDITVGTGNVYDPRLGFPFPFQPNVVGIRLNGEFLFTGATVSHDLNDNGSIDAGETFPVPQLADDVSSIVATGDDTPNDITIGWGNGEPSVSIIGGGGGDRLRLPAFGGVVDDGPGDDTVTGSPEDDTITAGIGNDCIIGGGGNDELSGGAGFDTILGGDGDDLIDGEDGSDSILGGAGDDTLLGRAGDDTLNGERGFDSVSGGEGNDNVSGGAFDQTDVEHDTVEGDAGNDSLFGWNGTLRGGLGDDTLFGGGALTLLGGDGDDELSVTTSLAVSNQVGKRFEGGDGGDSITGGRFDDTLLGESGNDTIDGAGGDDDVQGGADDDSLSGGHGNDVVAGGAGDDTLTATGFDTGITGESDTLDGGTGFDTVGTRSSNAVGDQTLSDSSFVTPVGTATLISIEFAELTVVNSVFDGSGFSGGATITASDSSNSETIIGTSGDDLILNARFADGGPGEDTIEGTSQDDTLRGGDGDDLLFGAGATSAGGDLLEGGAGADELSVVRLDGRFVSINGVTTLRGGDGNDTLQGNEGTQILDGENGDDFIFGDEGNDTLMATGDGFDTLNGGDGNDLIDASAAEEGVSILGGNGEDTITGSAFADEINGDAEVPVSFGSHRDSIDAGDGDDVVISKVTGNFARDTIRGGLGEDLIQATGTLFGDDGDDHIIAVRTSTIFGGAGDDQIEHEGPSGQINAFGGEGDDTLIGGLGINILTGGVGDDSLDAGRGAALFSIDPGNDIIAGTDSIHDALRFLNEVEVGSETIDLPDGGRFRVGALEIEDLVTGDIDTFTEINRLEFEGSDGDDFLDLSNFKPLDPTELFLPNDIVEVQTGSGNDELIISPYAGNLDFGDGDDLLRVVNFSDQFPDVITTLVGQTVFFRFGSPGPDQTTALRNLDRLHITAGNEENDINLSSFDGDATIVSAGGDDTLTSSQSDIDFDSGTGNDTLIFANNPGEPANYRVTDSAGSDTLDFSQLQAGLIDLDLDFTGAVAPLTPDSSLRLDGRFEHVIGTSQPDKLSLTMLPMAAQSFLAGDPGDGSMPGDSLTVRVPPPATIGEVAISGTSVTAPGLEAVTLVSVEDVTIEALPDPTTRLEVDGDGNLVITDIAASGGKDDSLTISLDSGLDGETGTADDLLVISDPAALFENLTPNGVSVGLRDVFVPVSDVTGGVIIDLLDGDDSVVLVELPFVATVLGGTGDDTLDGSLSGNSVFLDGGIGNDSLTGSSFNDELTDGFGDDELLGNGGNDLFILTPGSDDIARDSDGVDVLNFSQASSGITLNLDLLDTPQTVDASGNTVQLDGQFETFVGSPFDDNLTTLSIDQLRQVHGGGSAATGDSLIVDAQARSATDDGLRVSVVGSSAIQYLSSVQNVTIVNSFNAAPTALDDSATTRTGVPVTVAVLNNDSDPENDTLTITATTQPDNGTVTINGGTTLTYAPNEDFIGIDLFTYDISDGAGNSATATVTIVVSPPPRATLPDSGGVFEITSSNGNVIVQQSAGGAIQELALLPGEPLLIDGGSGDDTLTLDLDVLATLNITEVVYDGLSGFDTLTVTGGSFGTAAVDLTNPTDGTINLDGTTIDFLGLEPVDMTGTTLTDIVLNLPTGGANAILEPFAAGQLRLRSLDASPTFEETIFTIPGGSITINGNDGDDQIDASSAGTPVIISGGEGADTLIGSGSDDTLTGNSGADSIDGGAGNDLIQDAADTINGSAGVDILRGDGSGATLDLTALPVDSLINIEEIDLSGITANTLTLNLQSVLDVTDDSNTLLVRRDAEDVVDIGEGWASSAGEAIDGTVFEVFVQEDATLKIQSSDVTPPSLTITPDGTLTNAVSTTFTFQFSETVTGFNTSDVSLTNGSAGALTSVDADTYTLVVTPVADGSVSVSVPSASAVDAALNNSGSASASITSDQTAPNPTITSTEYNPTVNDTFAITIDFDEAVSDFVAGDIAVSNGAVQGAVIDNGAGSFTATIEPTDAGELTVDVAASVASDSAGNLNSAATQFRVTVLDRPSITVRIDGPVEDVVEGDDAVFTVSLSEVSEGPVSVVLELVDGTAVVSEGVFGDFDPIAVPGAFGTVVFEAGETSKTVAVSTIQDGINEPDETFSLNVVGVFGGAGIEDGGGSATATIAGAELRISEVSDQSVVAGSGAVSLSVAAVSSDENAPVLTAASAASSSLPGFVAFVDGGDGTGTLTVDPEAGDAGSVTTITITATDSNGSVSTTFDLNVVASEAVETDESIIRINAVGGPVGNFSGDRFANTGRPYGVGSTIDISDPSIPEGTPAEIFQTARWDDPSGPELSYNIPVAAGDYQVNLYFAEIYGPTARIGGRVFDVSIEGDLVLDNFDVFVAAGAANKGIVRSFNVVSDGTINIEFGHVVENPDIMAIELIDRRTIANTAPVLSPIAAQAVTSSESLVVPVVAVDADPDDAITLTDDGLPVFANFTDNGNGIGSVIFNPTATDVGAFPISIQATSGTQPLTDVESFVVTVVPANQAEQPSRATIDGAVVNGGMVVATDGVRIDGPVESVAEGTSAVFTVSLDAPAVERVLVLLELNDGTATLADGDFASLTTNGSPVAVQFAPGEQAKQISIDVLADGNGGIDESFSLTIIDAAGTSIDNANNSANATIAGAVLKIAPTQNQIIAAGNGPVSIEVAATSTDGLPAMLMQDSLPTYATFTDNGNGTATVTFNPSASDIGSGTVSFTATDSNTSLSSSFDVEVVAVESVESNEPAIRINAVGGAVGGFSTDRFANTGRPFGTGAAIDTSDPSIPEGTPAAIFQTTRWDDASGPELSYNIPAAAGDYQVNLYFAEIWGPAARVGGRVFDVSIEGDLVLDNFDVFATAGAANKGIVRSFDVTSDGTINIDFGHVVQNPNIMAIEIIDRRTIANTAPVLSPIPAQTVAPGTPLTIPITASDADNEDLITLAALGLPSFATFTDNGDGTGEINVNPSATDEGLFPIAVQAISGDQSLTDTTAFQLALKEIFGGDL